MNKKIGKYKIIFAILFFFLGVIYFRFTSVHSVEQSAEALEEQSESFDREEKIEIIDGATFGSLMDSVGIDYSTTMDIYNSAKPLYDLVNVRLGNFLVLVFDKGSNKFKELIYKIDSEEELHVFLQSGSEEQIASSTTRWQAKVIPIKYDVKIKEASGIVESSMYQAALDNNIDERAIIELANVFQWTIDFAMDPRVGDTFRFVYEERYLNGEYVMPGRILAGEYTNAGQKYYAYYFEGSQDNKGYFDENGNSVQKMFLKAPVAFKYITSGFTTGKRYVEEFNVSTGHRAIDYAAPLGTPIRAVGDGTVISAGWSNVGYGNFTSIRHNGTYITNYAHQSKILVKKGQKVSQGEIIGYVGSTGFSTGPHLHFEMVKNGAKVNSLREVLPSGKEIADENKQRFLQEIEKFKEFLE